MPVLYRLSQNMNKKNTKAYGKWYAKVVNTACYGTDELAAEIQRNCSMKKSDVKAVLEELLEVMARELGNSHAVKLEGIGTFYPRVRSAGSVTVREFNGAKDILAVGIRFSPVRKRDAGTHKMHTPITNGWTVNEAPKNTVMPEPKEDEDDSGSGNEEP